MGVECTFSKWNEIILDMPAKWHLKQEKVEVGCPIFKFSKTAAQHCIKPTASVARADGGLCSSLGGEKCCLRKNDPDKDIL